jgi:hypothetical protein
MAVLLMLEALDVDLSDGLAALGAFEPLAGRGRSGAAGGGSPIDESYNASDLDGLGHRHPGCAQHRATHCRSPTCWSSARQAPSTALAEPVDARHRLVFCWPADEIPVGRPSADSAGRVRRDSGRLAASPGP